jgi:hypothetical protein
MTIMRVDTFKNWLQKKGCRFNAHNHDRPGGHASLVVKLGNRHSTLPLVGTHQDLDPSDVSRILLDLNLSAQELPGPQVNPSPKPERHDGLLARQALARQAKSAIDKNSGAQT